MENIFGLSINDISNLIAPFDVPRFRAKQIAEWMYRKGASSFDGMTNLSKDLRKKLSDNFFIGRPSLIDKWDSSDDETTKFLLGFKDGVAVECVLMRHDYGNSVCISTQAGCSMGCRFCASTIHGVERDLLAGEMLSEVMYIDEYLKTTDEKAKVDTLVLMGSGEPMMNYDNVMSFMRLIHEPYTLNMSYRSMTVSTAGIIDKIDSLANEDIPVSLAISLHAPNDDIRDLIMPVNKKYGVDDLIAAGKRYGDKTKRRVTYEYILIAGLNDSDDNAKELAKRLRGQLANVNLIPVNSVMKSDFQRPSKDRVNKFCAILNERHVAATVRREMGSDIAAACGQLRNRHIDCKS